MTLRRLDHVAVVVRSTNDAVRFFHDRMGLPVHSSEEIPSPHVRLTYLDAGNAFVQLVEPLDTESALAEWLDENGEGLHHICFGVDDVTDAVQAFGDDGAPAVLGSGRGRVSAFVSTAGSPGVRIECTEFVRELDVDGVPGWLAEPAPELDAHA